MDDIDFGKFYTDNYDRCNSFAANYIGWDFSADIVSDSFLKLYEMIDRLDCNRNIESLLMSIIKNRCFDLIRHKNYIGRYANDCLYFAQSYEELEHKVDSKELDSIVNDKLVTMPVKQQTVFISIRINGDTYSDTAKKMGITNRCVEYELKKATQQLREHVMQMYG